MNTTAAQSNLSDEHSTKEQPLRLRNIEALVSFFKSGIKPSDDEGRLGIELEHTLVTQDNQSVSYSQKHGTAWVLSQLKREYPEITTDAEGDLLGVAKPGACVTIEPAAQVELSAGPFAKLSDAYDAFSSFETLLESIVEPVGYHIVTEGYHPTATARSMELIPKQRYDYMNRYLGAKDTCGPCMMRGSTSTQVSIDYTSEKDCLRKLRIAFALAPIFSLICDNSPTFEGKPRTHQLVRTHIWQHVDNDRCGLVPGVFEDSFSLEKYAAYILDTPAILIPCEEKQWCYNENTFGEIYANIPLNPKEVEHAVSMFFNDVRLKTYIEIRPADAMPLPYVIAYAGLIKGLFYSPDNLDKLEELFKGVNANEYLCAQNNLMKDGYEAEVYGQPVATLCDTILSLAKQELDDSELHYLDPLAALIEKRTTLACLAEQA